MEPDENIAQGFAAEHRGKLRWRKPTQGPKEQTERWFACTKGYWYEDKTKRALSLVRAFLKTVTDQTPESFGTDASDERAERVLKLAQKHLKPTAKATANSLPNMPE
jgi:hypothetical protein